MHRILGIFSSIPAFYNIQNTDTNMHNILTRNYDSQIIRTTIS